MLPNHAQQLYMLDHELATYVTTEDEVTSDEGSLQENESETKTETKN